MNKTNRQKDCTQTCKNTCQAAKNKKTTVYKKPADRKNTQQALDQEPKLSRADQRQIDMTASILDEKASADDVIRSLEDRLYSLDAKEMNPIDRDLMSIRYAMLKAYSEVLFAMAHFEHVRIRRGNGEYLHRDPIYLRHYLFGDSEPLETRMATCKNECGNSCCKKACSHAK